MDAVKMIHTFLNDWEMEEAANQNQEDTKLRKGLSEKQIDKMVDDTFPASDPPSTY